MKTLFVFRHGETEWNRKDLAQGQTDIPLNDLGRAQARKIQPVLKRLDPEIILCSDLSRTVETARIATELLNVKTLFDPRYREASLGEAEGIPYHELADRYGMDLIHRWRSGNPANLDARFPSGESSREVVERTFEALLEHLSTLPQSRIGLSTHGGVIRRIMQRILPEDEPYIPIPNCVVYELHWDEELKLAPWIAWK